MVKKPQTLMLLKYVFAISFDPEVGKDIIAPKSLMDFRNLLHQNDL